MDGSGKQNTIADQISARLTRQIIEGELAQGAKIIEEELAQAWGVSRGPLREAIRRLEGRRLLTRIPHAGVRVVKLDARMLSELYVVREALEGMSARMAAQMMSRAEIDDLWRLLAQHEESVTNAEGKVYFQKAGDLDFHYRIASASKNQWLLQLLGEDLYQLLRMCRQRSGQHPSRPLKALAQHRAITEAIGQRDGELAEILMRRHISGAWQFLKAMIPEDEADS
jgi:DNA-binding GntR family transcriptional regulator